MDKKLHRNSSNKLFVDTNIKNMIIPKINTSKKTSGLPDFRGKRLRESLKIAREIGIKLNPNGISGMVLKQSIPPGTKLQPDMICNIEMKI